MPPVLPSHTMFSPAEPAYPAAVARVCGVLPLGSVWVCELSR